MTAKKNYIHPPCITCKGPVERRKDEKGTDYLARRTCSAECRKRRQGNAEGDKWHKLQLAHEPCVVCGAKVLRREGEPVERYTGRQTCGKPDCIKTLQRQKYHGNTHYQRQRPLILAEPAAGSLDFGAHNLVFRPDTRRISKPAAQTLAGVSAAWAVRE